MKSAFRSHWWSVELPSGWEAEEDEECVNFSATPPVGALQISASRKDTGPVTDDDLREFLPPDAASKNLSKCHLGDFAGYQVRYVDDDVLWTEWWLRCDNIMIYATYNVDVHLTEQEEQRATAIVGSLKCLDRSAKPN